MNLDGSTGLGVKIGSPTKYTSVSTVASMIESKLVSESETELESVSSSGCRFGYIFCDYYSG